MLAQAQSLLDVVFAGDFGEDDWDHSLGGLHVVATHGEDVIGHAAVIQRRLLVGGRTLRAGYVEGVGVHPTRRRQGIGDEMMRRSEQIIWAGYDIGALGATDDAIPMYERRGWTQWRGPLSAMTASGIVRTPDEAGGVYVLTAGASIDIESELTCDWRDGDLW